MRFMIIVKSNKSAEAGALPDERSLAEMMRFNEELAEAGVLLAAEGLQPTSKGARVTFEGTRRTVTHGPFGDARDLVAGFWLWEVKSLDEAIAWVKRCPSPGPGESQIEIRPVLEAADLGPGLTPALKEKDARIREEVAAKYPGRRP